MQIFFIVLKQQAQSRSHYRSLHNLIEKAAPKYLKEHTFFDTEIS
jgi:hypothetical protein